jgi:hypothetical protein
MVIDPDGYPWHHLCLAAVASAGVLHQAEAYLSFGIRADHIRCDDTIRRGTADMGDPMLGGIELYKLALDWIGRVSVFFRIKQSIIATQTQSGSCPRRDCFWNDIVLYRSEGTL